MAVRQSLVKGLALTRLSRALKFKVVSACDGKGLLCPFLGVACGKQGLGTFGWTQIQGEDGLVGTSLRS